MYSLRSHYHVPDAAADTHHPRACFAGTRIVLRQLSPEAESIYDLILALHRSCNGDWKALASKAGVEQAEVDHFLDYAAMFLGNMGNYKSFGDSKFIPRCSEKSVAALAATSPEASKFYEATGAPSSAPTSRLSCTSASLTPVT